jgi:hypothetical protein
MYPESFIPSRTRMVLGSGMAKTGRPTTYRSDVAGRIIDAVADGASLTDAALAAGVPRTTVNEWARDEPIRPIILTQIGV